MDECLRELERRARTFPGDDAAHVALIAARVRRGEADDPRTPEGYRSLARAARHEPSLAPLLDAAPEWRSSGGDPGASRWSAAASIARPRTEHCARIPDLRSALALAVDRGRAFVVGQGGEGVEVVALDLFSGAALWRRSLGGGPAASPVARGGHVFVAARAGAELRTLALDGATGAVLWEEASALAAGDRLRPGALALEQDVLVLPLPTSWVGSYGDPDGVERARLEARSASTGRLLWSRPAAQVASEVALGGGRVLVAVDFVLGPGRLVSLEAGTGVEDSTATRGEIASLEGTTGAVAQDFVARREERIAAAGSGVASLLRRGPAGFEHVASSVGGSITSLALSATHLLVGRGPQFVARGPGAPVHWSTAESPLPFAPRGVSHPPPGPRSAVVAGALAYLASPLSPSISAFDTGTGRLVWRHALERILVPEDGPRLTWPAAELGPADRGPLHLAPVPGGLFGITLSGYAFLIGD